MKIYSAILLASASFLLAVPACAQGTSSPARDWTTWGYDQQRSAWNQGETTLSKSNVSKLTLLWKMKTGALPRDVVLSTLTAPLVVEGVSTDQGPENLLYVQGADDSVFAIDADSGKELWHRTFRNEVVAKSLATWLCSNTPNATPVIDKPRSLIFLVSGDGKLHALNLTDGAERMVPTDIVDPFSRDWSLNLINGVVYTATGRGCGLPPTGPIVIGNVSAMGVSDLDNPKYTRFYTSNTKSAGPWGRGGVVMGVNGQILAQTADGPADAAGGNMGESILALAPGAKFVVNSFTPANWQYLNSHDLDMGSASVVVFPFQGRTLVAAASKEGVLYLLDAAHLGGAPNHSTYLYKSPQLGNDAASGTQPGEGVWGAVSTYATPEGKRFVYIPVLGPASKNAPQFPNNAGPIIHGGIMAFEVVADGTNVSLRPSWTSPDMTVPDPPIAANGVVYAIQTGEQTLQHLPAKPGERPPPQTRDDQAKFRSTPVSNLVLYAFDAETGKQIYSSKKVIDDWVHFSEPVVALGKVFVATHSGYIYAFGLK